MRVWDLPCGQLCDKHLLGEHAELHAVWSILTNKRNAYSQHPEVKRWAGNLNNLFDRHCQLVTEFRKRGFKHMSDLAYEKATDVNEKVALINTLEEQKAILTTKPCPCSFKE
jgi:hypothetical protein